MCINKYKEREKEIKVRGICEYWWKNCLSSPHSRATICTAAPLSTQLHSIAINELIFCASVLSTEFIIRQNIFEQLMPIYFQLLSPLVPFILLLLRSDMCISFEHLSLVFFSLSFTLMWAGEIIRYMKIIIWNTHCEANELFGTNTSKKIFVHVWRKKLPQLLGQKKVFVAIFPC